MEAKTRTLQQAGYSRRQTYFRFNNIYFYSISIFIYFVSFGTYFVSFGTFLACSIVGNLQSIMGQTRVERRKKTNVIFFGGIKTYSCYFIFKYFLFYYHLFQKRSEIVVALKKYNANLTWSRTNVTLSVLYFPAEVEQNREKIWLSV